MGGDVVGGAEAFLHDRAIAAELLDSTLSPSLAVHETMPFSTEIADGVSKVGGIVNETGSLNFVVSSAEPFKSIFNDSGEIRLFGLLFGSGKVAAEGDWSLFYNAVESDFNVAYTNGELQELALTMGVDDRAVMGRVLAVGTKSATGNSTAGITLPAVATGGRVKAALWVPTATSGSITVTIETAAIADPTFSSPTTQFTFTAVTTTATSELLTLNFPSGLVSSLWRAVWAGTPDHYIAVSVGLVKGEASV